MAETLVKIIATAVIVVLLFVVLRSWREPFLVAFALILEIQIAELPGGQRIRIPTIEEVLRVKAYLIVQRNQVRDYLDVAALADHVGIAESARILADIVRYYVDRSGDDESVVSALVPRLAHPAPRDQQTLGELARYQGLTPRWPDWAETCRACADLAQAVLGGGGSG